MGWGGFSQAKIKKRDVFFRILWLAADLLRLASFHPFRKGNALINGCVYILLFPSDLRLFE